MCYGSSSERHFSKTRPGGSSTTEHAVLRTCIYTYVRGRSNCFWYYRLTTSTKYHQCLYHAIMPLMKVLWVDQISACNVTPYNVHVLSGNVWMKLAHTVHSVQCTRACRVHLTTMSIRASYTIVHSGNDRTWMVIEGAVRKYCTQAAVQEGRIYSTSPKVECCSTWYGAL